MFLDLQVIRIPKGAQLLTMQMQHGVPTIWAIVDPAEPQIREVPVIMRGTGHPLPPQVETMWYAGTYQLDNGSLVFHVFVGGAT